MEKLFGKDLLNYFQEQNILIVGIGGIGCELLKGLLKYKFKSYHLTQSKQATQTDNFYSEKNTKVSLNPKYNFKKVAQSQLQKNYPHLNLISYTDNIVTKGINFFKQFSVVFLALDNIDARSYVNRYQAGTQGFLGQAMLIERGATRCYDCFPRDREQKTFPVCTIRTLPEKPVHCIIWAKYLFCLLFSTQDQSNLLDDQRDEFSDIGNVEEQVIKLFNTLFNEQIKKQTDVDDEKFKNLQFLQINSAQDDGEIPFTVEYKKKIHEIKIYISMFIISIKNLIEQKKKVPFLFQFQFINFEKDDEDQMRFITACSNLRSFVFYQLQNYNIQLQNEFEVKKVAGNIVNAICSTNSIAAAIQSKEFYQVNEYIKYLQKKLSKNQQNNIIQKEIYIKTTNLRLMPINIIQANKSCMICQENAIPCIVYLNFDNNLLGKVIQIINKNDNYIIMKNSEIIYEQGKFFQQINTWMTMKSNKIIFQNKDL